MGFHMASPIMLASTLSSAIAAQNVGTAVGIATLKKTNDVAKIEGEALVRMMEESLPQAEDGKRLDIYG
jgi:hypothetical protein